MARCCHEAQYSAKHARSLAKKRLALEQDVGEQIQRAQHIARARTRSQRGARAFARACVAPGSANGSAQAPTADRHDSGAGPTSRRKVDGTPAQQPLAVPEKEQAEELQACLGGMAKQQAKAEAILQKLQKPNEKPDVEMAATVTGAPVVPPQIAGASSGKGKGRRSTAEEEACGRTEEEERQNRYENEASEMEIKYQQKLEDEDEDEKERATRAKGAELSSESSSCLEQQNTLPSCEPAREEGQVTAPPLDDSTAQASDAGDSETSISSCLASLAAIAAFLEERSDLTQLEPEAFFKALRHAPRAVGLALRAVCGLHEASVSMQVAGVLALEHLALGDPLNGEEIVAARGVQALSWAAQQLGCSDHLQEAICKSLLAITLCGASCRDNVYAAGALQVVLQLMFWQPGTVAIQVAGCRVLKELAVNSCSIQRGMVECHAVEAVLAAMRMHPSSATLQEVGCGVIRNLSLGNVAHQNVIASLGGLDVVLLALRAHAEEAMVQWAGCWAMFCLTVRNDVTRADARERGALHLVVQAMLSCRRIPRVQEAGCWALKELCLHVQDSPELLACERVVSRAMKDLPFEEQVLKAGRLAINVLVRSAPRQPSKMSAKKRHTFPCTGARLATIDEACE